LLPPADHMDDVEQGDDVPSAKGSNRKPGRPAGAKSEKKQPMPEANCPTMKELTLGKPPPFSSDDLAPPIGDAFRSHPSMDCSGSVAARMALSTSSCVTDLGASSRRPR
jgi:hypothetical protein